MPACVNDGMWSTATIVHGSQDLRGTIDTSAARGVTLGVLIVSTHRTTELSFK
jgi:hypothetical protein